MYKSIVKLYVDVTKRVISLKCKATKDISYTYYK
jgi:hypothetical protein